MFCQGGLSGLFNLFGVEGGISEVKVYSHGRLFGFQVPNKYLQVLILLLSLFLHPLSFSRSFLSFDFLSLSDFQISELNSCNKSLLLINTAMSVIRVVAVSQIFDKTQVRQPIGCMHKPYCSLTDQPCWHKKLRFMWKRNEAGVFFRCAVRLNGKYALSMKSLMLLSVPVTMPGSICAPC